MVDWIRTHETIFWWLAAASVVTLVATLIVVPLLVVRIPPHYFAQSHRRRAPWANHHPLARAALLVAKNVLGCVFIVVGLLMLVLPGQGLLTILVGITLVGFPGKYRLERWVVARRPVLRSINWLRRRANRSPLCLETRRR